MLQSTYMRRLVCVSAVLLLFNSARAAPWLASSSSDVPSSAASIAYRTPASSQSPTPSPTLFPTNHSAPEDQMTHVKKNSTASIKNKTSNSTSFINSKASNSTSSTNSKTGKCSLPSSQHQIREDCPNVVPNFGTGKNKCPGLSTVRWYIEQWLSAYDFPPVVYWSFPTTEEQAQEYAEQTGAVHQPDIIDADFEMAWKKACGTARWTAPYQYMITSKALAMETGGAYFLVDSTNTTKPDGNSRNNWEEDEFPELKKNNVRVIAFDVSSGQTKQMWPM